MFKLAILMLLTFTNSALMAAPVYLGDSEGLGLNDDDRRVVQIVGGDGTQSQEKISNLGDGVYLREFDDFGNRTVEVHPEAGPSYYYDEQQLREPPADDGVMDRQTPTWMIKQW